MTEGPGPFGHCPTVVKGARSYEKSNRRLLALCLGVISVLTACHRPVGETSSSSQGRGDAMTQSRSVNSAESTTGQAAPPSNEPQNSSSRTAGKKPTTTRTDVSVQTSGKSSLDPIRESVESPETPAGIKRAAGWWPPGIKICRIRTAPCTTDLRAGLQAGQEGRSQRQGALRRHQSGGHGTGDCQPG